MSSMTGFAPSRVRFSNDGRWFASVGLRSNAGRCTSQKKKRCGSGKSPALAMRYCLTLEYDGGPFAGWQRQENGPSVQAALEDAIFKLSAECVTLGGAGRTDAGVHAYGQVAHFDLQKEFAPEKVRDALNHHVKPAPIAVLD